MPGRNRRGIQHPAMATQTMNTIQSREARRMKKKEGASAGANAVVLIWRKSIGGERKRIQTNPRRVEGRDNHERLEKH